MYFDYITYIQEIAANLKLLQNTDDSDNFSKASSLPKMEEYLSEINSRAGFQLMILDSIAGKYQDDKSDNFLDRTIYTFFIFKYVELNNFIQRTSVISVCKTILHQILSKFFLDRMNYENNMEFLQRSSINYDTIGPIGNNCHGIMVHFAMLNAPEISYDSNEWLN